MLDKSLVWCGNALLAAVLVVLCAADAALADDTVLENPKADLLLRADEPADDDIAGEGGPSGTIVLPITGQAQARRFTNLAVTPGRFETGLVEIGAADGATLELEHTGPSGSDPVSIGAVDIEGKSADEYAVDFTGGITLNPGDVQPMTVTFTPRVPGAKSASLMLEVEGATAPYVVFLSGQSRYPLVSELEASALDLGFGQVIQNEGVTQTLTLTNSGDPAAPAVNVSAAILGGDNPDAFQVGFVPTSLAPGESIEVPVTMISPAEGTKNAKLEIVHDGNNASFEVGLQGQVVTPVSVPVSFGKSVLSVNVQLDNPTAIQFGPDGKLYLGEVTGLIRVFDVARNGANDYQATQVETVDLIQKVPNHDDQGNPEPQRGDRQMTGFHVVGSAASPVIYAASSDPEHGAGSSGADKNLDTNSGILHKLTKGAGGWQKQDLVRGLPRSEENHTPNGIAVQGNTAYLLSGGHTNMGIPSFKFAALSEYALSGALLKIDLGAIGGETYDLPTLDDEDRPGNPDANDPFGGNNGKNQAKLVAGGPVQIFYAGLRNAYDIVLTQSGKLYTFDNGPNSTYGAIADGSCSNAYQEFGGADQPDNLHLMTQGGYGGHPNPVRGSKDNTFNASNPQSPIEVAADPRECDYFGPGEDGSLTSISSSTNGIDEYTASNFASTMKGDLLTVSFNKEVTRIELNGAGDAVTSKSVIAGGLDGGSLAISAQGDSGPFPGTIWIASYFGSKQITVLEPSDY